MAEANRRGSPTTRPQAVDSSATLAGAETTDTEVSSSPALEAITGAHTVAQYHSVMGNALIGSALFDRETEGVAPMVASDIGGSIDGGTPCSLNSNQTMRHAHDGGVDWSSPALRRLSAPSAGNPLPSSERSKFEAAFGHDFSGVRIHTDSHAAQAAEALNAHAFAIGSHIYFGQGTFAPGSSRGDQLLAHELTHVVQHDQGRLGSGSGVSSPSDPTEQEAYANESRIMARLGTLHSEADSLGASAFAQEEEQASVVVREETERLVRRLAGLLGLSGVRVHADETGAARAQAARTRGLAEGGAVYLDPGTFDPSQADGRRLIAHEVAHIKQDTLAPVASPMAGGIAEAEAHAFASHFVTTGNAGSLQYGLPSGHVAAENGGGGIDVNNPTVATEFGLEVAADLTALASSVAFLDLAESHKTSESEGASEEGASCEESESSNAESSTDGSDGAGATDTSQDPAALLEEIKASDHYTMLVEQYARTLTETAHGVISDLSIEFEDQILMLGLDDDAQAAMDEVMGEIMSAAEGLAVCEDASTVEGELGAPPIDPTQFEYQGAEGEESEVDVPAEDEVAECTDEPMECALEEPEVCEVETLPELKVENPVSGDIPDGSNIPALVEASEEAQSIDEDTLTCEGFSEYAGDGVGLHFDRVPEIWQTMVDSAAGPFMDSAKKQFADTFLLDTLGTVGDKLLQNRLGASAATKGVSKVPLIGPLLTLGKRGWDIYKVTADGDPKTTLLDAFPEVKEIQEGVTEFGKAADHAGEAFSQLTQGNFAVAGYEGLSGYADYTSGIAKFTGALAGICGLLSAILFVVGFALAFTGVGTAAAPFCVTAAKFLAEACTILGIVSLWAYGLSTLFTGVAAALAPTEAYDEQLKDVKERSKTFGDKAGGFAGDKLGQKAGTTAISTAKTMYEAGKIVTGKDGDSGGSQGGDGEGRSKGGEAGANKADTVKTKTDKLKELVSEKLPTFKKTDADGNTESTWQATVRHTLTALGSVTQVTALVDSIGTAVDHAKSLHALSAEAIGIVTSTNESADALKSKVAEMEATLAKQDEQIRQAEQDVQKLRTENEAKIEDLNAQLRQYIQDKGPGNVLGDPQVEALGRQIADHQEAISAADKNLGDLKAEQPKIIANLKEARLQAEATKTRESMGTAHTPAEIAQPMVGETTTVSKKFRETVDVEIISVDQSGATVRRTDGEPFSTIQGDTTKLTWTELQDTSNSNIKSLAAEADSVASNPVSDTANSEDFGGQSSGNATGGVGSIYIEVLDEVIAVINEKFEAADAVQSELGKHKTDLDSSASLIDQANGVDVTDQVCDPDDPHADIDAAAFWDAHGEELNQCLDEIEEVQEDATTLTTTPEVDVVNVAEKAELAVDKRIQHTQMYTAAYSIGFLDGMMCSVDGMYPDDTVVQGMENSADLFGAKLDDHITKNEEAQSKIAGQEAPSRAPDANTMAKVGEARDLVGQWGSYASSSEVGPTPECKDDPSTAINNSQDHLKAASEDLTAQNAALSAQKSTIDGIKLEIGGLCEGMGADKEALSSAVTEVGTQRTTAESDANSLMCEADTAAADVVTALGVLSARGVEIDRATGTGGQ